MWRRVLSSRKMATAGELTSKTTTMTAGEVRFGPWVLDPGQIFLETSFSYGVVNLKPIVPGHVLIISKRICPRLSELTPEEVSDLFTTVHRVGPVIERHYQGDALNIAIQDGVSAGQTVPHVHVHILPRKSGDFERNDEIHERLDQHDATIDFTKQRLPRSREEMAAESRILRQLFQNDRPT